MTPQQIEAMKLALEAMESVTVECNNFHHPKKDQNHHWAKCPPVARWDKAITAIKEALAQTQEPVAKYCCRLCFNKSGSLLLDRMILCSECGNKRCPKATNHELQCTESNAPNQAGSIYTAPPQRTWVNLTYEQVAEIYNKHGRPPPVNMFMIIDIENKIQEINP